MIRHIDNDDTTPEEQGALDQRGLGVRRFVTTSAESAAWRGRGGFRVRGPPIPARVSPTWPRGTIRMTTPSPAPDHTGLERESASHNDEHRELES
jgi:hypothetical protein